MFCFVEHRNVIRYYNAWLEQGKLYIQCEYCRFCEKKNFKKMNSINNYFLVLAGKQKKHTQFIDFRKLLTSNCNNSGSVARRARAGVRFDGIT